MSLGMVDEGHIIHAQSMYEQTFWLAWGTLPNGYPSPWTIGETPPAFDLVTITETDTRGSTGLVDTLANTGVVDVIAISQGANIYTANTNYIVTGNQITWISGSSPAIPAPSTTYSTIYQYNTTAITGLLSELGRRIVTIQDFVIPSSGGSIQCNGQNWALNHGTPSNAVYLEFDFDSSDAVGNIIYQIGLFVGTTLANGVPTGTQYLLPNQIANPGELYMVEALEPFSRFAGKREIFQLVIQY